MSSRFPLRRRSFPGPPVLPKITNTQSRYIRKSGPILGFPSSTFTPLTIVIAGSLENHTTSPLFSGAWHDGLGGSSDEEKGTLRARGSFGDGNWTGLRAARKKHRPRSSRYR